MIAFHITKKNYEEGKTYNIKNYNGLSYYHISLNEEQKKINDIIDSCRPSEEPSRKKCFYAFEEKDFCLGFVDSLDGYKLYQIEINATTHHPMCLIDFLNRNTDQLHSLADVYWNQSLSKDFQIKEFIGTEIRIMCRLELSQNNSIQRERMITMCNHDKDVCRMICKSLGI